MCLYFLILFFVIVVAKQHQNLLLDVVHVANYEKTLFVLNTYETSAFEINIPDSYGRSVLMNCGFDPQRKSNSLIDKNCSKIADVLIAHGANPHIKDNLGWDALAFGAFRGFRRYCQTLLKYDVNVDGLDSKDQTSAMKALRYGFYSTFSILLEHGADIQKKDDNQLSLLHHATIFSVSNSTTIQNRINFLTKVLTHFTTFDLDSLRDDQGRSPLMYAVLGNQIEIIRLFLSAGCDPRLSDGFGVSSLSMARSPRVREELAQQTRDLIEREHKKQLRDKGIVLEDEL